MDHRLSPVLSPARLTSLHVSSLVGGARQELVPTTRPHHDITTIPHHNITTSQHHDITTRPRKHRSRYTPPCSPHPSPGVYTRIPAPATRKPRYRRRRREPPPSRPGMIPQSHSHSLRTEARSSRGASAHGRIIIPRQTSVMGIPRIPILALMRRKVGDGVLEG